MGGILFHSPLFVCRLYAMDTPRSFTTELGELTSMSQETTSSDKTNEVCMYVAIYVCVCICRLCNIYVYYMYVCSYIIYIYNYIII